MYTSWDDQKKKREKGTEGILETMTEGYPQMNVYSKAQNQEAQRTPSKINANNLHPGIAFSNYR